MIDRIEAEDLARARWYSFFSRWFLAPPDEQAISLFIPSPVSGGPKQSSSTPRTSLETDPPALHGTDPTSGDDAGSRLEAAWQAFVAALAGQSLADIRTSYDDTFLSVGEAPVSLHASVYLTGFSNERPLAEVRQWLESQGIQSSQAGLLTEDHLGLLCEAMAWLIIGKGDESAAGGQAAPVGDEPQQHLFQRFISPVCDEFCQRLKEAPEAGVYSSLGELFAAFGAVERQAFDIDR